TRPSAAERSDAPVRVAVLNASGIPRLADRGRAWLRDDGRFDVKEIGNAPGFSPDSSVVLDRVGKVDHARAVADALGISRVESRPDANLYLDVTVVLGKDWAARNPERPASAAP
ncbi:LytR C-terminal domain-containing protein, partial [Longimicrobium sp.]|uniref:LytR C-terminal domain-containing protein n=1 Tax=Longimicrobium sp. TaxID=2029185 RepID=UPI002F91D075